MEKKLKFFDKTGKFDDASYLLTDNEPLIVLLQVDTGRTVDYYVTLQNENGKKVNLKAKNKQFEVPKELLTYGSIDTTIVAKVGNNTVKTIFCEKLIVKDVGGQTQVIPEIEALHLELNKTNQKFIDYKQEVNEKLEKMRKCIEALMEG
ncbi:MAG: hypothetical protein J6J24_03985 [Clostridia bacterium]|nr:hypothetical protein [Clostridia bacterium]